MAAKLRYKVVHKIVVFASAYKCREFTKTLEMEHTNAAEKVNSLLLSQ